MQPAVRSLLRAGKSSAQPDRLLPSIIPFASAFPHIRFREKAEEGEPSRPRSRRWRIPALLGAVTFCAVYGLLGRHTPEPKPIVPRTVIAPTILRGDNQDLVRWHRESVDVVLDSSLDEIASSGGASVFARALDAWRATGAKLPSVSAVAGKASIKSHQVGYNASGANQNSVLFAKYGWAPAHGALAVTVLTYDKQTGAILDADIVLNGGGRFFAELAADGSEGNGDPISIEPRHSNGALANDKNDSAASDDVTSESSSSISSVNGVSNPSNPGGRFDLQNILAHELGHFFGLGDDHENNRSTMYSQTRPGETTKRVIDVEDATSLEEIYSGDLSDPDAARGCGGAQIAPRFGGISGGHSVFSAALVVLSAVFGPLRRRGRGARCPSDTDPSSHQIECRTNRPGVG